MCGHVMVTVTVTVFAADCVHPRAAFPRAFAGGRLRAVQPLMVESFDVVIVGGGPTGLLLASEIALANRDASVVVLERLAAIEMTMKASALGALGAEALERRGLGPVLDREEEIALAGYSKAIASAGNPVLPGPAARGFHAVGGHFAGLFLIDQTKQREPARRNRMIGQQTLERILAEHATKLGVEVRREHEVLSFEENDDAAIMLDVRTRERTTTLKTKYLVGCDGGRSFVRKNAGFEFPGTEPTITGHQVFVELDHPERMGPLGWRRTTGGMISVALAPGRMFLVELDGPPPDRNAPITREEIEMRIRRVSGADVRVKSVKAVTRFTDHARQASTYRRGRILLAGDAAHVHPPFGGPGLTLGLLDAANLGWKLGAAVRGGSNDLLDTYTRERHPHAACVLQNARAQVALMRPDPQSGALRDLIASMMAQDDGNRFFGELTSGITTRYDLDLECDDERIGLLAGNCPVIASRTKSTLYTEMQDGRAVLIDGSRDQELTNQLGKRWRASVKTVIATRDTHHDSMLVRPDGCIAWSHDPQHAQHNDTQPIRNLKRAIKRWFGPGRAHRAANTPALEHDTIMQRS